MEYILVMKVCRAPPPDLFNSCNCLVSAGPDSARRLPGQDQPQQGQGGRDPWRAGRHHGRYIFIYIFIETLNV